MHQQSLDRRHYLLGVEMSVECVVNTSEPQEAELEDVAEPQDLMEKMEKMEKAVVVAVAAPLSLVTHYHLEAAVQVDLAR
jgi:hypothetical protein